MLPKKQVKSNNLLLVGKKLCSLGYPFTCYNIKKATILSNVWDHALVKPKKAHYSLFAVTLAFFF